MTSISLPPRRRSRSRLTGRLPWSAAAVLVGSVLVIGAATADASPSSTTRTWVGTWSTSATAVPAASLRSVEDQTVRQVVHTSIAGQALRLRLTNEFGDTPLTIGETHVAVHAAEGAATDIDPDTDTMVTFGGEKSVTIPPGAPMVSDEVPLSTSAGADLVVSLYVPELTPVTTVHAFSYQENVLAAGNVTAAEAVTPTETMTQWYFLSGVSVLTRESKAAAVVAFGDSITDGANTTVVNHRWPDLLAERFRTEGKLGNLGVLNQGISGNRLLHDPSPVPGTSAEGYAVWFGRSALTRFDKDVLSQPGARYLIVLLGVNDIGQPGTDVAPPDEAVTAQQVINAHRQLIARAHARGMKVIGGTILPFKDDTLGFWDEANEVARQDVNTWIRTSGEYDAVIDFDVAMRDPEAPQQLLAAYDSGDHLHPNETGMQAMADAIPLEYFN